MARTARSTAAAGTAGTKTPSLTVSTGGGFDITSRAMAETAEVELVDPIDATITLPARITIWAPNTPVARAVREAHPIRVKEGKIDMTDEEFETVSLEHAIAVTKDWNLEERGAPIPCTPDNVRRIYTDQKWRWIAGQVRNKQLAMASFFPKPKTV